MKTTAFVKIAASTLILGATMVGCSPASQGAHPANASDTRLDKTAGKAAAKAHAALAAKDFAGAVDYAEAAVASRPRDAGYRMLLGQAYLGAGRFASAQTAFSDTLTLSPDYERAALNLALADIALGKKSAALTTLADYRDRIPASDYGLAIALAGDTAESVRVLEATVRAPGADAKARQNLALAYALAGEWNMAQVMAGADLTPADADARILQWAAFARPGAPADQVAGLLGVRPVADAGQPTRLALAPTAQRVALAETPVAAPVAVPAAAVPAPVNFASAQPVTRPIVNSPPPAFETATHRAATPVAPVIRAAAAPVKQAIAAPSAKAMAPALHTVPNGKFFVQVGAFENAAVSQAAWNRDAGRFGLKDFDPANSAAHVNGANYVRLAVGGFATHAEAAQICGRIQHAGGRCFVRGMLADKPAQWAQRGTAKSVRVAAR